MILTENNAPQYESTGQNCLDLFSHIGTYRNGSRQVLLQNFNKAFKENPLVAAKILFWVRAARIGGGERAVFHTIMKEIIKDSPKFLSDNAKLLAQLGYWKDLYQYFDIEDVQHIIAEAIHEKDRLACKWAPRKGPQAKILRNLLSATNKKYRKWLKKYSETDSWMVFHHKLTAGSELKLDTSDAQADDASNATWGDNHPGNISSTVFEIGYAGDANASGSTYIAYCFKSIQGYSKFGSYAGNSDADGAFIYTGFKPAWVLARNISAGQSWWLFDNARTPYNGGDVRLRPDRDTAEYSGSKIDFVSNGFKWRDGDNAYNYSGNTFIYMAFAHQPFVTSGGVPCTAF